MSIQALVSGKLIADPDRRSGQSGKPFTLAKVVAHDGEADSLVSVIAFNEVAEQLAALGKGDAVALSGSARVSTWQSKDGAPKAGLSLTAEVILTAYHVRRKRALVEGEA